MSSSTERVYLALNEPGTMGGIQRVVASLAGALAARGVEVTVVGIRPPRRGEKGLDMGVPTVYPFPRLGPRPVLDSLNRGGMRVERLLAPWQWLGVRRLRRMLRERPGHVVAMDVFMAELVGEVPRAPGLRRVVQYHNSFDSLTGTRDMTRLVNASSRFDSFLALTESDADSFRHLIRTQTSAIPNPVPYAPAPAREGRAHRVLSIGRLSTVKNVELTVSAWARLPSSVRQSWTLTIAGDGPRRPHIEKLIEELDLLDSVEMVGPLSDSLPLMRDSRVLALSSTFEGLPMVLLEAMSQGVACLATDSSPGVHGLLTDGRGALVPIDDVSAFTRALERLLQDDEHRDAVALRGQHHMQNFDQSAIADRWLSLLGMTSNGQTA